MKVKVYNFHTTLIILFAFLVLASHTISAEPDIDILQAKSLITNGIITITMDTQINLPEGPTEALQSGVPLFFDLNIEISRGRRYMWNQELFKTKYIYSLQQHTLSKQYILKNLITDTQKVHGSIATALQSLGKIRKLAVIDVKELVTIDNIFIAVQFELKINALPAPMMPLAYISPQWHVSSKRYKWKMDL